MNIDLLYSPADWEMITGVEVVDPDGFKDAGVDFQHTPISIRRFFSLSCASTARWPSKEQLKKNIEFFFDKLKNEAVYIASAY